MLTRLESPQDGSAKPAEAIQAFCRHVGELCDVLTAPYDMEAFARAASSQELQVTNCNRLLQHALYEWLGERVELSLGNEDPPEEASTRARKTALAAVRDQDMISNFVQLVATSCASVEVTAEVPKERHKHSLLFDIQGPLDLLGPEEVDGLLIELNTSDAPLTALEALVGDVHLLEDLCFGPSWPQLCDGLGRLVGLSVTTSAVAATGPGPQLQPYRQQQREEEGAVSTVVAAEGGGALPTPGAHHQQEHQHQQQQEHPQRQQQQQLLLRVLQELASSTAVSSPPHAAELLAALAPHLMAAVTAVPRLTPVPTAAVTAVPRLTPVPTCTLATPPAENPPASFASGSGAGTAAGPVASAGGASGACLMGGGAGLLSAATAVDCFTVGLVRVTHQLLGGLAAEFHTLPPGCAALAARAVCDVVRSGVVGGAPAPLAGGQGCTAWRGSRDVREGADSDPPAVQLSALDLLVLLDPEVRWWQRLCAATHATQPMAEAAAATPLMAALEAALAAWAAATAAAGAAAADAASGLGAGASVRGKDGDGCWLAAESALATHLVACTALLGGLVRANNTALLGSAPANGSGGGSGVGGLGDGGNAGGAAMARSTGAGGTGMSSEGRPGAAHSNTMAQVQQQQQQQHHQQPQARLQRMLSHLLSCFCRLADKPWLLRARGVSSGGGAAAGSGGGGSVFLCLAADVLSAAAGLRMLNLHASREGAGEGDDGTGTLAPLVQGMLRAAAVTAAAAAASTPARSSLAASGSTISEVEVWLGLAARVLQATTEGAVQGAAVGGCSRPPAAADAMCSLLRHIAGRLRGCAGSSGGAGGGGGGAEAPMWSWPVVRCAADMAAVVPAVAAALSDLYDTLYAVLVSRRQVLAGVGGADSACVRPAAGVSSSSSSPPPPPPPLIDVLSGSMAAMQHQASPAVATAGQAGAYDGGGGAAAADSDLDAVQSLAAQAVLSYCSTEASAPPALPAPLRRQLLLQCAARWLCGLYDDVGAVVDGARGGGGCARLAAKRRIARTAGVLAGSCLAGQRALVAAGFTRRVLNDVAAVLRSGQYESPFLEPLPYDPLAGLAATLADVLCWPGLLLLLPADEELRQEDGERQGLHQGRNHKGLHPHPHPHHQQYLQQQQTGVPLVVVAAVAAAAEEEDGAGLSSPAELQPHRTEVLALLQELVTWLDTSGHPASASDTDTNPAPDHPLPDPRNAVHADGAQRDRSMGSGAQGGDRCPAVGGTQGGAASALPPQDAAAVSLGCFARLVAGDPGAAAALERETNVRWYLQNLAGELPVEGAKGHHHHDDDSDDGRGSDDDDGGEPSRGIAPHTAGWAAAATARSEKKQQLGPGHHHHQQHHHRHQQQEAGGGPPQSDMLLDLARAVLRAMSRRDTQEL